MTRARVVPTAAYLQAARDLPRHGMHAQGAAAAPVILEDLDPRVLVAAAVAGASLGLLVVAAAFVILLLKGWPW